MSKKITKEYLEYLEKKQPAKNTTKHCVVEDILDEIDDQEAQDKLRFLIEDTSVDKLPGIKVLRLIRQIGIKNMGCETTILRHRRKDCICFIWWKIPITFYNTT